MSEIEINKNESTEWSPTLGLRWLETSTYDPINDCFVKILQQLWHGNKGHTEWRDIEIVKE